MPRIVDKAMPQEDELVKLPRWALVALAARCARRAEPLIDLFWNIPDLKESATRLVRTAIAHAAESAEAGKQAGRMYISEALEAAAQRARKVGGFGSRVAAEAALSAAYALKCANLDRGAAPIARDAAEKAVEAASAFQSAMKQRPAARAMVAVIRHDLESLKTAAQNEQWTDETPVSPHFFGSLWPNGEPEGWPTEAVEGHSAKDTVPTEKEIEKLPRWARVAFAARCARRVLPLFRHFWPDAPQQHLIAVYDAQLFSEEIASSGHTPETESVLQASGRARTAADAARREAASHVDLDAFGRAAAEAALAVADAADGRPSGAMARGIISLEEGDSLGLDTVANDWIPAMVRQFRIDFESVKHATEKEKWTNETRVPPEFFGPLWPDGEPVGWPKEEVNGEIPPHVLKLEIAVPRGMTKSQSREFNEKVVAILSALSAADASMGGTGLQILDDASEEPIDIECEEPTHDRVGPFAGVGA